MYEMYPDAWTVDADRQHQVHADRPRRRARKEHSVVPAILQARPTRPAPLAELASRRRRSARTHRSSAHTTR